jgi:hypothetical protein
VLSKAENRYLARQLCWVLTVQSLETYIVQPRDPRDFESVSGGHPPTTEPHGHRCRDWYAGAYRSAGALQWAHGPNRCI